ncbi:extracellular matrix protein 2 [Pholidichthys leucotaenia]
MQVSNILIVLICLSGTVLGQEDSLRDMDGFMENSVQTRDLEIAPIHSPAMEKGETLLDTQSIEDRKEHPQTDEENEDKEAVRRRRSAWGMRKHAATVEGIAYRIAGLGRPLFGWRKRGKPAEGTSALMAALKELHAEKRRLMDQGKAYDYDDDDDDDEDDEEEEEDDEEEEEEREEKEDDKEEEEEKAKEEEEEKEEEREEKEEKKEEEEERKEKVEEEKEEKEEEKEEKEEEKEEEELEKAIEALINQTGNHSIFIEFHLDCQIIGEVMNCRNMELRELPVFTAPEVIVLNVSGNNIRIITPQSTYGLPNLDTLDLSQNELDDDSFSQDPLYNLTRLKKLILDSNQITRIPALPPSLEELRLNKNKISTLTPHSFKGLKNLIDLQLKENNLHDGSVSPLAFKSLKRLLNLQLSNNHFASLPLGLPPSIQVLRMNGNGIVEVTEDALRCCTRLRVLELTHNHLHQQRIALHAWTWLKSLEDLNLSHNRLTSVPTYLPRPLRNLTLQHNDISHIPSFVFRHLQPGLHSLCLSHNALSDGGIEQFSFVGTYRPLTKLLLDNNRLQEIPRCIRQFKNLQELRLNDNKIRRVRQWGVCHPRNTGTTLASLHLENNLLEVKKIPQNAFSCLTDVHGLVLYPQQGHTEYNQ